MNRVLFVDESTNEIARLRAAARKLGVSWEIHHCMSSEIALSLASESTFDVVVVDQLMPGMDGLKLLEEFRRRIPTMIRVLVSGTFDWSAGQRVVSSAHRFLRRPYSLEELFQTIRRALYGREILGNHHLQNLASQTDALPSLPSLYLELVRELDDQNTTTARVGGILSKDMSMCSKMLRLVNSPFFALGHPVSKPEEAVGYLGLETVKAMVLSLQIFSMFGKVRIEQFPFEKLWNHSWFVGRLAQQLSKMEGASAAQSDLAFTAGILHDIGKLMFIAAVPDDYAKVIELQEANRISASEAERCVFNATHAELGAYLLGLWGLPDQIVEAIGCHHKPEESIGEAFSVVTAIHAANSLDNEMQLLPSHSMVNLNYIESIGLGGHVDQWREKASGMRESVPA